MDNLELTLILRNTEKASRDAEAAFAATELLVISVGARFDGLDSRVDALESRVGAVEKGIDGIARSNHRIEQMLGVIATRLS